MDWGWGGNQEPGAEPDRLLACDAESEPWTPLRIDDALDARVALESEERSIAEWLGSGIASTLGPERNVHPFAVAVGAHPKALAIAMAICLRAHDRAIVEAIIDTAAMLHPERTYLAARSYAVEFGANGPPRGNVGSPRLVHRALTLVVRAAARVAEQTGRVPEVIFDPMVEAELAAPHAWPIIERYLLAIGGERTETLLSDLADRCFRRAYPDATPVPIDAALVDRMLAQLEPPARERLLCVTAERGASEIVFANVAKYGSPRVVERLLDRAARLHEEARGLGRAAVEEQREIHAKQLAAAGLSIYGVVSRVLGERGALRESLRQLCEATLEAIDGASACGAAIRSARIPIRDARGLMPLASARRIVAKTTVYRKGEGEVRGGLFVLESDVVWAALLSLETAEEFVRNARRIEWQFHVRGRENLALFERWGAAILPWIESRIDERRVLQNIPWCIVPCLLAIDGKDALRVALKADAVHEILPAHVFGGALQVFSDRAHERDLEGAAAKSTNLRDDAEALAPSSEDDDDRDDDDVVTELGAERAPDEAVIDVGTNVGTAGLDLARRWLAHHPHGYAMLAEMAEEGEPRAAILLRERAATLGGVVREAVEAALGKERTDAIVATLDLGGATLASEIEEVLANAARGDEPRGPLWTIAELDDAAREFTLPLWDSARYTTGAMRITGFASRHGDALVIESIVTNPGGGELVTWHCRAFGPGARRKLHIELLVDTADSDLERLELSESAYVEGLTQQVHVWREGEDGDGWHALPVPIPHEHVTLRVCRAALPTNGSEVRVGHHLPRTFDALAERARRDLRAVSPDEGLLFQLCAARSKQMFAFTTALAEKVGLPPNADVLFTFDDFEWVRAGELASRSPDVVLMVEALRRRHKITRLVGTPNAKPEVWAPVAAEVRSYRGSDAWPEGEAPIAPNYAAAHADGVGATPYLSWLVAERGYPHGVQLMHAAAHNGAGQAEQTVTYLVGCTSPVMQGIWPRRTACVWARALGMADAGWTTTDEGVVRAMKKDGYVHAAEAASLVAAFVARRWQPPTFAGAEFTWLVEALVGPREVLDAFASALEALPSEVWTSHRPALAAAVFELGFVLRRTPRAHREALVTRFEELFSRVNSASANDVVGALDLVLHGRKGAERHARAELDYAFVDDDRAWARPRILSSATLASRPDMWLYAIAGESLLDKWSARFDAIDVRWLALQVAKIRGAKAFALALRLHAERPETRASLTQILLDRPTIEAELRAALDGSHPDAARALLSALERRRFERFEADDDGDD